MLMCCLFVNEHVPRHLGNCGTVTDGHDGARSICMMEDGRGAERRRTGQIQTKDFATENTQR